jgi:nucleoside-diphosphate-sugar epimerase
MRVAIIGCGYVGTAIAHHWRQELGLVVTATTTRQERVSELSSVPARVVVLKGDDAAALESVLQDQDTVLLSVGAPNANAYEETYLRTAETLVKVLEQTPTVQQLIYTGSYAVYGDRDGAWVDEDTSVAPANQNGEILCNTEQVLLAASSHRLGVCIFRLGGIYGPGRELAKIFRHAAGTTRPGTGVDATNWIHRDDIVAAVEFARQKRLQGIYNLVNDVPLTSRELLERLCERHGLAQVSWDPSAPKVRPYNARVSNQKLKAAGYQFIYPETVV